MVTTSEPHDRAGSARRGSAGADGHSAAPDLGAIVRLLLDGVGEWASAAAAGTSSVTAGFGSPGFMGGPQGWADLGAAAGGSPGSHTVSTCGVCPICLGLAALARSHPEVLTHLSAAVQSVVAAVASMAQPAPSAAEAPAAAEPPTWGDEQQPEPDEQRIKVTE